MWPNPLTALEVSQKEAYKVILSRWRSRVRYCDMHSYLNILKICTIKKIENWKFHFDKIEGSKAFEIKLPTELKGFSLSKVTSQFSRSSSKESVNWSLNGMSAMETSGMTGMYGNRSHDYIVKPFVFVNLHNYWNHIFQI